MLITVVSNWAFQVAVRQGFFFARLEPGSLHILLRMHFVVSSFPCLSRLSYVFATTHVSSRWSRSMSYHVVYNAVLASG
jgi:hypothetical protein